MNLDAVIRDSGAQSDAKGYLLEALQLATDTQTHHTALQALMEIAEIEMRDGNPELALEFVSHCLQHPSSTRELLDRSRSLRADLVTQLTPQQIEAADARAHAESLESLARKAAALD